MNSQTRKLVQISLIATFGIVLFVIESYFPRIIPWAKPGLANIATLIALYSFDWRTTIGIVIIRVLAGSLLIGTLFTPAFLLSITGGLSAATVMLLFSQKKTFSVIGTSIVGAVTHLFIQLFIAFLFFVKSIHIFNLVPFILLSSIGTGVLVGLAAKYLLDQSPKLGLSPRWYSPN